MSATPLLMFAAAVCIFGAGLANLTIADRATLGKGVNGLKIGLPKEYFIDGIDPEMTAAIHDLTPEAPRG